MKAALLRVLVGAPLFQSPRLRSLAQRLLSTLLLRLRVLVVSPCAFKQPFSSLEERERGSPFAGWWIGDHPGSIFVPSFFFHYPRAPYSLGAPVSSSKVVQSVREETRNANRVGRTLSPFFLFLFFFFALFRSSLSPVGIPISLIPSALLLCRLALASNSILIASLPCRVGRVQKMKSNAKELYY